MSHNTGKPCASWCFFYKNINSGKINTLCDLIYSNSAFLWDGQNRLQGTLELWEYKVVFKFDDFQKSHLTLVIPIWEILSVETFLLFELTLNGIRIENKKGHEDTFIVEDASKVKRLLLALINQATKNS